MTASRRCSCARGRRQTFVFVYDHRLSAGRRGGLSLFLLRLRRPLFAIRANGVDRGERWIDRRLYICLCRLCLGARHSRWLWRNRPLGGASFNSSRIGDGSARLRRRLTREAGEDVVQCHARLAEVCLTATAGSCGSTSACVGLQRRAAVRRGGQQRGAAGTLLLLLLRRDGDAYIRDRLAADCCRELVRRWR